MINKKYVILGVAFEWEERKGLDVFIDLAKCLNEEYQIILVGTDDRVDKLFFYPKILCLFTGHTIKKNS